MRARKILHLTPHVGGGVGAVLYGWLSKAAESEQHTVICFDMNQNAFFFDKLSALANVAVVEGLLTKNLGTKFLDDEIAQSDVVVLHWWNHPLTFYLLQKYSFPASRLLFYIHCSGLFAPYILTKEVVQYSDYIVFTSPISFHCSSLENNINKNNVDFIWSTSNLDSFFNIKRKETDRFCVGYIGTSDFAKLHGSFFDLCERCSDAASIDFAVCSNDDQQHLKKYIDGHSLTGFRLLQNVNPQEFLPNFDVFGYPLQPCHFGTCEQALGEAMAAGCVPVVLNNPAESYIVEHEKSGLVARSPEEYSAYISRLYHDRYLLAALSINARKRARYLYDLDTTLDKWQEIFAKMMLMPKRHRDFGVGEKCKPSGLYAISLGEYGKPFCDNIAARNSSERTRSRTEIESLFKTNPMFYSKNKGSVLQYLKFFPDDAFLASWAELLGDNNER